MTAQPGSYRDALGSFVDATRKLAAATRTLDTVRALHQPRKVPVPVEGGGSLTETRCSCTPGLLHADCPTARVLNPKLKGPTS